MVFQGLLYHLAVTRFEDMQRESCSWEKYNVGQRENSDDVFLHHALVKKYPKAIRAPRPTTVNTTSAMIIPIKLSGTSSIAAAALSRISEILLKTAIDPPHKNEEIKL